MDKMTLLVLSIAFSASSRVVIAKETDIIENIKVDKLETII